MSVALADKTELRIPAPELRGAMLDLAKYPEMEIGVDGPAGCVAGETRIYNPVTNEHIPIKELYEKGIAPIVQTLMGAIQAAVPFRKGVRKLYRVTLASGRQCIVTENHIFLTSNGWCFLSSCVPGSRLLISSPCPRPTTEASGPSVSPQDALRLSQTPLGSQEHYSAYSHLYDAQLQMVEDSVQVAVPSQGGAHEHSRVDLCEDDQDSSQEYTHHSQHVDRHARMCYSPLSDDRAYAQFRARLETFLPSDVSSQYDAPSLIVTDLPLPIVQSLPDDDSKPLHEPLLDERLDGAEVLKRGVLIGSTPEQLEPYSVFADMTPGLPEIPLQMRAYSPSSGVLHSLKYTCKYDYTIQWDTVSSIEYERTDEYFDLHVPIAEHYLAEGIWHHNTGKTYGILYFIHVLLLSYPKAKWLVARKFNIDLAGSALSLYRESILDEREGVRYFGGNKVRPAAYLYPNGSEMIVNGLDRSSKVKSMDFDGIYINEATDCDIEDVEMCHIRLARRKNSALPERFQKLLMDFNPDAPTHFLNQRMNEGRTRRLLSRHEDNPFLWDANRRDWTEAGYRYITELETLTGVRYARYRLGLWVAAEGTVYQDSWDRARNVIDRFPIPKEWPRYLCVDFGYTNPFVCAWWAMDPDGRLFCYREIYKTKTLVEDHAKQIKYLSRWGLDGGDPLPREIICDHDAEDRATLERHLGLMTSPAHKSVSDGIQAVAARMRLAGDGKPRIAFFRDALVERDMELARQKKPTCTIEEPESYVWAQTTTGMKEEPVKENDHGLDSARYIVARFDLQPSGVTYYKDIWR